jgi:16S rRNA (uracil1498-N3)-methyltransferase
MHSFYVEEHIRGEQFVIHDADQLHHLRDVLRLKKGDAVSIFDPTGQEYLCSIADISKQNASLEIIVRRPTRPPQVKIAVACALSKKSGFDDIVDKLTQIGVDVIIPLLTERVIVKPEEAGGSRSERWRKIARSAAEQSRRNLLPSVRDISSFKEIISESSNFDLKLVPTLEGDRQPLNQVIAKKIPASILVLIGPEGDFTPEEVRQAIKAGFQPITLGANILKVDTAAVAVAAYLRLALLRG